MGDTSKGLVILTILTFKRKKKPSFLAQATGELLALVAYKPFDIPLPS